MSSWGHRQQVKYITTIVLIAIVLAIVPIYYIFFNNKPTCFDGRQNQNESGIDCGGSCLKVCEAESLNPIVLYTRILEVTLGTYSVVSDVENPNPDLLALNVKYVFRIYDQNNVQIAQREGSTFIPPNKTFPIFEGSIKTVNTVPARVEFEFSDAPLWRKATSSEPVLNVINSNLTISTSTERLDATLQNSNPYNFQNIEVVALLYDADGNLTAASKTTVDNISKGQQLPITFTWPEPFGAKITKIDIVPKLQLSDFIPTK